MQNQNEIREVRKMKRVVTFLLCVVMLVSTVGCGGFLNVMSDVAKNKKLKEDAAKIATEITSGEFVLNGVVYEFPMDLKSLLDNGWKIPDDYVNADVFKLEPGVTSDEFELENMIGDTMVVTVINDTLVDAKLEDCLVSSIIITSNRDKIVLPKGITSDSKFDDVVDTYGGAVSIGSDEEKSVVYSGSNDSSWLWRVELGSSKDDNKDNLLTSVEYYLVTFANLHMRMVEEKGQEEVCKFFVNTIMNACYKGDFNDYNNYCFGDLSDGEELYQGEIDYLAEYLMYYTDISDEYASETQLARVKEVAKQVLSTVKWEIESVSLNSDNVGTMDIKLYPSDFIEVTYDLGAEAVDNYYAKYKDLDFKNVTTEELAKLESEYIDVMIGVLEKYVSSARLTEPISKSYVIDIEDGVFTEEQWYEIDDYIMGIKTE